MNIKDEVRKSLMYYIEQDLEGDELLMKEVYENCEGKKDLKLVEEELKAILEMIEARLGLP